MRIVLETEFTTREGLDAFVRSRFGVDQTRNANVVIEAPAEQLTVLGLSEESTVYGVRVRKEKK